VKQESEETRKRRHGVGVAWSRKKVVSGVVRVIS